MTMTDYCTLAVERFGRDKLDWKFVCPACGHIASARDYRDAGAPWGAVGFSCVGRWLPNPREAFGGTGPGPCNYAGGGLFGLNPVQLDDEPHRYFNLAEAANG